MTAPHFQDESAHGLRLYTEEQVLNLLTALRTELMAEFAHRDRLVEVQKNTMKADFDEQLTLQALRVEYDRERERAKEDLRRCETKVETIEERLARVEEEREQDRDRAMERNLACLEGSSTAANTTERLIAFKFLLAGIFFAGGLLYLGHHLGYNRGNRACPKSNSGPEQLSTVVAGILADLRAKMTGQ
ncbi:hypothetical protein BDN72DRAFT_957025 [Pluteus cervinus]|uniref:Uncharacterized protein n=1 Tax=Pluteus cervinus TaxID=181527 RepID=A0ACD3B775_9AGAR|nr:hypothetical protein BDN72DRAFT_957025 [Pluteus cervinus]